MTTPSPERYAEWRRRQDQVFARRERVLETARELAERAKADGYDVGEEDEPHAPRAWFVMRRETAEWLLSALLRPGQRAFAGPVRMYGVLVLFSDQLALDQIVLAYEGFLDRGVASPD